MSNLETMDYYATLGVGVEATAEAIKSSYRTLARKLHPDINKATDAQKRFSELGEAYEVLGDPEKRKLYDDERLNGWRRQRPNAPRYRQQSGHGEDFSVDGEQFSEFYESMFGQRRSRRPPQNGEDLHHTIELTLEESYAGGERHLQLQLPDPYRPDGGQIKSITVKIPSGLAAGDQFRLKGQGSPGPSADRNGNLYLKVAIKPHAIFRAEGRDILLDLPIAPWEAVLGGQVATPTLGGEIALTIPAGSQNGQRLRLRGRGLPGKSPGDQYVILRITVPTTTDEKSKTQWQELAAQATYNPRQGWGPKA